MIVFKARGEYPPPNYYSFNKLLYKNFGAGVLTGFFWSYIWDFALTNFWLEEGNVEQFP